MKHCTECDREAHAHGLCSLHYKRLRAGTFRPRRVNKTLVDDTDAFLTAFRDAEKRLKAIARQEGLDVSAALAQCRERIAQYQTCPTT